MALVVEDGTGVAGATSYVSVADFKLYAAARGATVPATDPDCEVLLIKAMDALEIKLYVGEPLTEAQGLSFPRQTLDEYGAEVSTGLPAKVVQAQCALAVEAQKGDLLVAARANKHKRTKIDQIYVEYQEATIVASGLYFPQVDALLAPWLVQGSHLFSTVKA